MKILYFTQLFYPSLFGGGENVFFQWAKELKKRGHDVFVITQRLENTRSFEEYQGIKIFRVGSKPKIVGTLPVGIFSNFSFLVSAIIKGIQLARKNKFDLIHSNTYIPVISAQVCSRFFGIPHIATVHDVYLKSKENFWKDWSKQPGISNQSKCIGPWIEKKIAKTGVTLFHTVSKTSKSDLEKMGVKKKIVVIPNAIDLAHYKRKEIDTKNQAIFIGRLVFYKNLEILIKAFAQVVKKIPDAKLVIVGDGPSKQSLIDEALSAGLDKNVDFKGTVSDDEKIKLLYESRVLLNPSLVEGFGLVILEAFSCSKPVIVSDTRPLSDLVSDTNDGFVLSASDSNQWANKLVELISNPALCEKMGKAGLQKVVTQYSLEKIIDSVIDLYDTVRLKKNS